MRGRSLALLLVCAPLIASAVSPSLTIDHYPIAGVTARALRADMNRLGPANEAGVRKDGYTHWDIQWRYGYDRSAAAAPKSLIATWQRFSDALRTHEDGHYNLAIEAADEVGRVLQANRTGSDCKQLEARLNAAGKAVLEDLRRRQARYDRDTDSGRRQGTNVL